MHKNKCFSINSVAGKVDKYTKYQLKAAQNIRELENIIIRPGNGKFVDVCIPCFTYCPVSNPDIKVVNDIYGKIWDP